MKSKSQTLTRFKTVQCGFGGLEETLNSWFKAGYRPIHIDTSVPSFTRVVFEYRLT